MIVPGLVGYSCNKVVVAETYFKYQFCLKRCTLILFTLNKPAPEQVYISGPVAMTASFGWASKNQIIQDQAKLSTIKSS